MKFLEWHDTYNVNIKQIDEQHQHFIELINQLYNAVVDKLPKDKVVKILDKVVDYTDYHFKTEEELFEAHDYPGFEIHKQQHDDLQKQIQQLQEDFAEGRVLMTLSIIAFMNEWLITHILDSDQEYVAFFNAKGVF